MNNGKVVTIIPNWNLKDDIGECIDSLLTSTWHNHEIMVIDNNSTDGSAEWVKRNYPDVMLIELKENIGYAGALNAGIRCALERGAEYVFCINNDTVVPRQTIELLVMRLLHNKAIGILSPKILINNRPDVLYSLGSRIYRYFPLPIEFGHRWRNNKKYQGLLEFDYVTGCAVLIRASLFQIVGLFDESYFMYYEDDDFCRRTRDSGFKIACDANTTLFHKVSLSSNKQASKITFIRARNRVWFYRRYKHGPSKLLTYLALWIMALIYSIKNIRRKDWLLRYWSGFIEGWRSSLPTRMGIEL